jgi:hypothetical protein
MRQDGNAVLKGKKPALIGRISLLARLTGGGVPDAFSLRIFVV